MTERAHPDMRVIVTAAGAGPGTAIVKALMRMNVPGSHVVAVDMSENAAGLYLAHAGELVPGAKHPDFIDRVLEVAKTHRVNLVIPIFDLETPVFAAARTRLEAEGVAVAVNSERAIAAANDKVRSFEVCEAAGIRQPERFTHPSNAPASAYPLLGKPIGGVGSKGMVHLEKPGDPIPEWVDPSALLWQRFIRGAEYSIDTWGRPGTDRWVAVPRHRRVVRDGQMVQGETDDDPDLLAFAARACEAFGISDVSCLQVIRGESDRELYFVEMNPRYGTGISLSIAAGVPFPRLQWLAAHDPDAITPEMLRFRPGLRMIRYWEEIFR